MTMFQNNPLLAQLKEQLHNAAPRVEGIVKAHEKGFGFLELDNKKSYFIPIVKMKKLLHGDRIQGTLHRLGDKDQFEPDTLIESALNHFVGRIDYIDQHLVVFPEHSLINQAIRCRVHPKVKEKLHRGSWVVAKLVTRPLQENQHSFSAEICDFIAAENNILAPWLKVLSQYELPRVAPHLTKTLCLLESEKLNREDLTHLPFFSIDNCDTTDIDDAIYLTKNEDDVFEVCVAIADPSAYIEQESQLDQLARERMFTTYLPDFKVPMLPIEITDDLCSLNPNEKRAAVVCQLYVDKNGDRIGTPTFKTAWITSTAKLNYSAVSDYLDQDNSSILDDEKITKQLHVLKDMAQIRIAWRRQHALLFKDRDDYKFILGAKKEVIKIIKQPRGIANQMVEEAMILVNQAFAESLNEKLGFAIFNVHQGFDPKHSDTIAKLLNLNDISEFNEDQLSSFEGYCALRRQIATTSHLESRLLKYHSTADLSSDGAPHFGLGFPLYATWTSPLRKYSDLVNHRLLKAMLRKESIDKPSANLLKTIVEHRRRQRFAERDIVNYLYRQFFNNHIGEVFNAEIIDINRGGAKVRLTDTGAIAFMPVSLIHNKRDEIKSDREAGEIKINQMTMFKITDQIRVVIQEIKEDTQSIIVKYQKNH